MSTILVSQGIWPTLTKTVRGSRQRCAVAVAYFGKGARHLLPLSKGSSLVVDASERSVASGQTCPADLLTLVKRGVVVYSVANLHAKVLYGRSNHHKIEAIFKCFARAMRYACSTDQRLKDQLPSTKGLL